MVTADMKEKENRTMQVLDEKGMPRDMYYPTAADVIKIVAVETNGIRLQLNRWTYTLSAAQVAELGLRPKN